MLEKIRFVLMYQLDPMKIFPSTAAWFGLENAVFGDIKDDTENKLSCFAISALHINGSLGMLFRT
jgi:hypothetical protein